MADDPELALFEEDRRVFLDWGQPFLSALTEWLWPQRQKFPEMLVVVPTSQSGRRLREALAELGGCFSPKVITPGFFLHQEGAAPEVVELLGWIEVLEGIEDWEEYSAVFPVAPGQDEGAGWSMSLARSLLGVRRSLLEGGLMISAAAKRLAGTVEGERWRNLAELEKRVERLLEGWGMVSRSTELLRSKPHVEGVQHIVIAGVVDLPPMVEKMLEGVGVNISVLLSGKEKNAFDSWGRPLLIWNERELPWPGMEAVHLTADPHQQAEEALRLVAQGGHSSDEVALGAGDEESAQELESAFTRAGWSAFDPGKKKASPLAGWLKAWRNYLAKAGAAEVIDLLGFEESGVLVSGKRAQRVVALSTARDRFLVRTRADVERAMGQVEGELAQARGDGEGHREERIRKQLDQLSLALETLDLLEKRRRAFLSEGFHRGMERLLGVVDPDGTSGVGEWLSETAEVVSWVDREAGFWVDLLRATLAPGAVESPDDRVLDVNGWVELFYEPGGHLVMCGMNEGIVPSHGDHDPWLPESARRILGIPCAEDRAARDAYLFASLVESRREKGRVDFLFSKSSLGGDVLSPSRLLLATQGDELARRVQEFFQDVEPPESGLAWTMDEAWRWKPREVEVPSKLNVTAFSDYLACPFRFYLKHLARMNEPDPERVEWNARDFGNVAHLVVERWARDECARDLGEAVKVEEWVFAELDRIVGERFGESPPLAVQIQCASLRQRLSWFAVAQAQEYAEGWRVVEVEKSFTLDLDGIQVRGQVDRIEEHRDGRRRILDYKTTAEAKKVEGAHRKQVNARTNLPPHLEGVDAVLTLNGKKRWTNLQVALYSAALGDVDEIGYFALGATEGDVGLRLWEGYEKSDEESALRCARWVVEQVKAGVFWPPASRVEYDDLEVLALGRTLDEVVEKGGMAS